jgi:hypothetical protein
VGRAIAARLLPFRPSRLVIGALREDETQEAVEFLRAQPDASDIEIVAEWGNVFQRESLRYRDRSEALDDPEARRELLWDVFGVLDEEAFARSTLVTQLARHRPAVVIDCINTATAIAYQNVYDTAGRLWKEGMEGRADLSVIEAHLTTLYLPQLIRHVQLLLEGLRRAESAAYVKIGTSGTGGMGLNVPFTHSEEKPSRELLAKASVAGAHSALLFLMGRTPDAPAVVEIKPTAAIAWKRIGFGPITRGGHPIPRYDATRPVTIEEAFAEDSASACEDTGEVLESVYLDAGENGMFSLSEFETISSLRMMEIVTPEEIADAVVDELEGRPTGRDVVAALDGSVLGPTYRGGMLREVALSRMEALEEEHGVRSVAFEMLGPPLLNKLLFEATILERLFEDIPVAMELDPAETSERAHRLIEEDARLRTDILSIGIPILLPDGRLLRGEKVKIGPRDGEEADVDRLAYHGWVDLRPACWVKWRDRCARLDEIRRTSPGADAGSSSDLDVRAWSTRIRAGALAALVLREEEGGTRIKQ